MQMPFLYSVLNKNQQGPTLSITLKNRNQPYTISHTQ